MTKKEQEKINKENEDKKQEQGMDKGEWNGDGSELGEWKDWQWEDDWFVKMKKDEFESFKKTLDDLNKYKEDTEKQKQKKEQDDLIASWKIEEAYKLQLDELNNKLKEKDTMILNEKRNSIVKEYWIPEKLSKFVIWNTPEEIEAAAKEISESLKSVNPAEQLKDKIWTITNPPPKKDGDWKKIWTMAEVQALAKTPDWVKTYIKNKDEINEQIKKGLCK